MGTLWQPGCLRTRSSWRTVLSTVVLAHRSTLLTTMKKGTFRAKASPRCSRVVPATSQKGGRWQEREFGRKEKKSWCCSQLWGAQGRRASAPPFALPLCSGSRTDSSVGTDEEQGAVGAVGGEAEDGGVQVFVVARQVNEGDHLGAAFADLFCGPRVAVIHHLAQGQALSALCASPTLQQSLEPCLTVTWSPVSSSLRGFSLGF